MSDASGDKNVSSYLVAFWVLMVAAAIFRIWLATKGHSIRHPDEIFQTFEQAHRIVFGYGIVPWEFREGIRWIGTPLMLTPPLWLAAALGLGPDFYVPLTRALLALVALAPFPLLFEVVRRRSGDLTALLSCLLPMVWVENLDYAGSTLSEAIVAPFLACAILLALLLDKDSRPWHAAVLAVLLAATFCLRFHLAPALALVTVVAWLRMSRPLRSSFFVSMIVVIVGLEGLDMAFGQIPFQHVYLNIYRNVVEDIAQHYGVKDAFYYVQSIWDHWGPGLVFPVVAIGLRWRSTWLLAVSAILIVLAFSAIGHKEYRFYYPATLLFTLAGGWALAELSAAIAAMAKSRSRGITIFLAAALVLITVAPERAGYASVLSQTEDNRIALQMLAARQDNICGLGFDIGLVNVGTAGLVHFHRKVAYDTMDITPPNEEAISRFNYVIVKGEAGTVQSPYELMECRGNLCLYRREGGCAPSPPTPDGPGPD